MSEVRGRQRRRTLPVMAPPLESPRVRPVIDYPREGEHVLEGIYAIRVSAPGDSEVEISIDNGDWLSCRESSGHWWFDWIPLASRRCKIQARARVGKGRWLESEPRTCHVGDAEMASHLGLTFD